jgi:hypothetical protein
MSPPLKIGAWAISTLSVNDRVDGQVCEGLNSVIILGAWAIWTHHNRCVFNGISLSLTGVISLALEELRFWSLARARGVSYLLALAPIGI